MGLKVGYSNPVYPPILQILIETAADPIRHAHLHRRNMQQPYLEVSSEHGEHNRISRESILLYYIPHLR